MRLRLVFGLASLVLGVSLLAGCQQQQAARYTVRPELQELSPQQQQVVIDALTRLFGTPTDPHIRLPEENEEGEMVLVDVVPPEELKHGLAVYNQYCVGCHGVTGDGAGPAADFLTPRPRDYRLGIFKFTSTPYGLKPHRLDLERTIRHGARGTSMPSHPWLAEDDLRAVTDYVMMLSRRGEVEKLATQEVNAYDPEDFDDEALVKQFQDEVILSDLAVQVDDEWRVTDDMIVQPAMPEPPVTEENILAGQQLFLDAQNGCFKCHGMDGRGGILDPENALDDWGEPIKAADLTTGFFHGGRRPVDIYRRIDTGINARMPSFNEVYGDDPEKIWQLVQFVTALSEGRELPLPPDAATGASAHGHGGASPAESEEEAASIADGEAAPLDEATGEGSETVPAEDGSDAAAADVAGDQEISATADSQNTSDQPAETEAPSN